MTALKALCAAGGTIRVTVFRAYFQSSFLNILANIVVSCTVLDKTENALINLFTVKGTLTQEPKTLKLQVDTKNSKDPEYPNFWFGTGFSDYISADTIKRMVDCIPENGKEVNARNFVEFRVLEDGTIENVDIYYSTKQKREIIADTIVKSAEKNEGFGDESSGQIECNKIIGVSETDSIVVIN